MQKRTIETGGMFIRLAPLCLFLAGANTLWGQTTPSGQVLSPGATPAGTVRSNTATPQPCTGQEPNSTTGNTAEPNCIAPGPGFANPSTNTPALDRSRAILSLVRIEAVVPRPPVTLPEGDSFSTVGPVTLVKLRRPEVAACLATGRRISARAGAPTSTTCLDSKGDVLAYEECRANSTEVSGCTVVTGEEIARQQTAAKSQ